MKFPIIVINGKSIFPTEDDPESKISSLACKICKFKTNRVPKMNEHNTRHKRIDEVKDGFIYFCDFCELAFQKEVGKKVHNDDVHGKEHIKCEKCKKNIPRPEMNRHVYTKHHYIQRNIILNHPNVNLQAQPKINDQDYNDIDKEQTCAVCGKNFENLIKLMDHYRTYGTNHYPECVQCPYKYRSWEEHKKHIKLMHDDVWKFKCGRCLEAPFIADTMKEISQHFSEKHKYKYKEEHYSCEICGATYKGKGGLEYHKVMKHGENVSKYVACSQCTFMAHSEKGLKSHLKRDHSKANCDLCNEIVKAKHIELHKMSVHNIGGKVECTFCGKQYPKKGFAYKTHLNTHTNEKPFKCQHCDKRFADRSNCKNHVKQVHLGIKRIFKSRKNQISPLKT